MEILDIFGSDTAFKMATLTQTINHGDYKPGRIGQLGLYEIDGVPTTTVVIEEEYSTLKLVPTSTRGGPATPSSLDKRKARPFVIPHIAVEDSIVADQLQNVRGYAQGMEPSAVLLMLQELVNKKLAMLRDRLEPTIEYHRMGGIKGQILDSDGSTVIYNLFTEFGVSQQTAQMLLNTDTTDVNKQIRAAQRLSLTALGNQPIAGWHAFCGDSFFDKLVGHKQLRALYLNWQAAQILRDQVGAYALFNFGQVMWENYRGSVGGVDFVPSTKAYLFPLGARGLFINNFGPSDYIDRVNNIPTPDGLPIEARQWMPEGGKSVKVEAQSNPLCLCTKPRAVIELAEDT